MKYSIKPVIRTDKKDAKGLVPIYLFIYNPKLTPKISLGEKIEPELWDAEERRVKRKSRLSTLINSKIEKQLFELKSKILTEEVTKEDVDIKTLLKKEQIKDICFYEFAET